MMREDRNNLLPIDMLDKLKRLNNKLRSYYEYLGKEPLSIIKKFM